MDHGSRASTSSFRLTQKPKSSVVITSKGTSLDAGKSITIKGRAKIHDDKALKEWFYPSLRARSDQRLRK